MIQLNRQNYDVPQMQSGTAQIVGIGTDSIGVLAADAQRQDLTFHNPNNGDGSNGIYLFVCQAFDADGNALAASVNGPGVFVIAPGTSQDFSGNIAKGAWNVCAAAADAVLSIIIDPPSAFGPFGPPDTSGRLDFSDPNNTRYFPGTVGL